jgi:O-antigen ligase
MGTDKGRETSTTRRLRAFAFVFLLIGTLLPPVGGISLTTVAIALTVPLLLFELQLSLPRVHPVLKFVVPLFAVLAAPVWLNPPITAYGHDKATRLVTLTLLSALAAALVRGPRALLTAGKMWIAVGVVLAGVTTFHGDVVAGRLSAFDNNPIWLGRALASAIIFLAWMTWQGRIRRLLALPVAVALVVGLYFAGSRGPAMGCVVGLVALALFANKARTSRLLLVAGMAVVGGLALTYSSTVSQSRLGAFLTDPGSELQGSDRSTLIQITLPVIRENPGGVGYGSWQQASGSPYLQWPHNLWLEVFAEAGWLVGAFLVAMWLLVVVRLMRRTRSSAVASLALALLLAETFAVSVSGDLNARTFFALLTLGMLVTTWDQGVKPLADSTARMASIDAFVPDVSDAGEATVVKLDGAVRRDPRVPANELPRNERALAARPLYP